MTWKGNTKEKKRKSVEIKKNDFKAAQANVLNIWSAYVRVFFNDNKNC